MLRLPELGVAVLLACGFASAGELLLARRSRDVFSWNESFLVGMGAAASLLFPLSLLLPSSALVATLFLLALALFVGMGRHFVSRTAFWRLGTSSPRRLAIEFGATSVFFAFLVGLAVLAFATLNLRYSLLWDGFQIWATKAGLLYHTGALGKSWFPEEIYDSRILNYPHLVPLYEALLTLVRGRFDFNTLKPIFLLFYLSMSLSTCRAARMLVERRAALAAVALLVLLPAVSAGSSAGGYCDLPQAMYVAAVAAACLADSTEERGWRSPVPWLIGSLLTVKSEGIILFAIGIFAVALFWLSGGLSILWTQLRKAWRGIVILTAFLTLRTAYLVWLQIKDTTYGPLDREHLSRAFGRVAEVASLCVRRLTELPEWGFFWPVFVVAALVIVFLGTARERCLVAATALAMSVYAAVFLFTNWELALHVEHAYNRLLQQVAPLAAVVIVAAYARFQEHHTTASAKLMAGVEASGLR